MPALIFFMFLIGASVFLYPTFSNYLAEKNSSKQADQYATAISELDAESIEKERQKAIEYNESLRGDPVHDPFVEGSGVALPTNYLEVLDFNGVMATVRIPKIGVLLPIMHGTGPEVLDIAVGHVRQTAVPIGGIGNHPVLTGHTGLPNALLFTDLTKLIVGDIFVIEVLDESLYYQIDDIAVIVPDDISRLEPIPDKDCVTLVTCTPYGINSHRLLVRGARIDPPADEEILNQAEPTFFEKYRTIMIVLFFIILLLAVWSIYYFESGRRRKRKKPVHKAPRL